MYVHKIQLLRWMYSAKRGNIRDEYEGIKESLTIELVEVMRCEDTHMTTVLKLMVSGYVL